MHIGKDLAERGLTISAVTLKRTEGLLIKPKVQIKIRVSSLENLNLDVF